MKLRLRTLWFALGVALLIIGADQMMRHGFAASYFLFMFALGFMGLYLWQRGKDVMKGKG